MNRERERHYYDEHWGSALDGELDSHQEARLKRIVRATEIATASLPPPWKILEVGCGTGWLSGWLRRHGEVLGVDLSPVAIKRARQRYPDARFEARDLFSEGLPSERFHLVVASEVIEHVECQQRFVDLLMEHTRPGGHLILTTPNAEIEERWKSRSDYSPQPIEQWLTPSELSQMLRSCCRIVWRTTFFQDYDRRGLNRLIHEPRYRDAVRLFGIEDPIERLLGRLEKGLYTIVLARRR